MNETNVTPHSLRAWLLAARPKTLPASAAPVMIGLSVAAADPQVSFKALPAVACLLFALLMQVASNFINDLYDYLKGSDDPSRLGPRRACAEGWISPRAMRRAIFLTVAVACAAGCVALCYAEGLGVDKNTVKAQEWLLRAAQNGDIIAAKMLETSRFSVW